MYSSWQLYDETLLRHIIQIPYVSVFVLHNVLYHYYTHIICVFVFVLYKTNTIYVSAAGLPGPGLAQRGVSFRRHRHEKSLFHVYIYIYIYIYIHIYIYAYIY